ncbi:hypothetical protein F2Q69_00022703 [Brassica cretica]|uniref:Uncharacterized protein n=1 Tax=Brassica cretica TaxID=69181 RepID=A0A8S9QN36_BRACR|nr:hypothetical protein F2Q69_00022703 [Brassica cretica]
MEDCVAQKIEVNELLKKGHLREFLSEKAKSHLSKETTGKPTEAAPVSPAQQDRVLNFSRPQAGQRPLDPRRKGTRFSGSPLGGTPVPCYEVLRVRSPGPPTFPGKRKTSDNANLPYFRIWKSLNYSSRLSLVHRSVLPEATQREAELQRQTDDLQGQVTGLHRTQEETNPELSLEF